MEKIIRVRVSMDGSCETIEGKHDITDDVFEAFTDAISLTIPSFIDLEDDEFASEVLSNYNQTLPKDFKNLKDMRLKIEVLD